jgi:hypothetical protein
MAFRNSTATTEFRHLLTLLRKCHGYVMAFRNSTATIEFRHSYFAPPLDFAIFTHENLGDGLGVAGSYVEGEMFHRRLREASADLLRYLLDR